MAEEITMSLELLDGDAKGRVRCSLGGLWSGVAYRIPRTALPWCRGVEELGQAGVFFLFGTDDKKYCDAAFIGRASKDEGLLSAMGKPRKGLDWTTAVAFTAEGRDFDDDELVFLENAFSEAAREADSYDVRVAGKPAKADLDSDSVEEMGDFVSEAKVMTGVLGFGLFSPRVPLEGELEKDEPLLFMNYKGAKAFGMRTAGGFVVYKGSAIREKTGMTCPKRVLREREDHEKDVSGKGELLTNIGFPNASAAAGFVAGAALNGGEQWQDSDGHTLKQIEDGRL